MLKTKQSVLVASICAGAVILASVGCSTWRGKSSNDERSAGRVTDDKKINKEVQTALENEPVYKFNDVSVKTFAGSVSLAGFVNTEDQKRRAEEVARSQSGVTQVINGIALKPEGPAPLAPVTETGASDQSHIYSAPPSAAPANQAAPKSNQGNP